MKINYEKGKRFTSIPQKGKYFIEALAVCVNYDDYLPYFFQFSKKHFNTLTIITSSKDGQTQKLCQDNNVQCVITDAFYENGDPFNKGKAINVGFQTLLKKDWIVFTDVDMILSSHFRDELEKIELNKTTLYGMKRAYCPSFSWWAKYMLASENDRKNMFSEIERTTCHDRIAGSGFFQMAHQSASIMKKDEPYPSWSCHAGKSDGLFRNIWKRTGPFECISHNNDFYMFHLPHKIPVGQNWNPKDVNWFGRKSERFDNENKL